MVVDQQLYTKKLSVLQVLAPQGTAMLVHFLPKNIEEKVWLVMYMVFSPHISAFFMSSLIQTAEHKMAAFTVMFSRLYFLLLNFKHQF